MSALSLVQWIGKTCEIRINQIQFIPNEFEIQFVGYRELREYSKDIDGSFGKPLRTEICLSTFCWWIDADGRGCVRHSLMTKTREKKKKNRESDFLPLVQQRDNWNTSKWCASIQRWIRDKCWYAPHELTQSVDSTSECSECHSSVSWAVKIH